MINNYLLTIEKATLLFDNNIKTNKCKSSIFVPILQPVNPRNEKEVKLWNKMRKSIQNKNNFIDYSNEDINFFDNVHVDQKSRIKIANLMKDDLLKIIKKKCN